MNASPTVLFGITALGVFHTLIGAGLQLRWLRAAKAA
jgi:hypothetical protein